MSFSVPSSAFIIRPVFSFAVIRDVLYVLFRSVLCFPNPFCIFLCCHALSPILSCLVLFCLYSSCSVSSCPVLYFPLCSVLSFPVLSCPVLFCFVPPPILTCFAYVLYFPALFCLAPSCLVSYQSYPVLICLVPLCFVSPRYVLSCPVLSRLVLLCLVLFWLVQSFNVLLFCLVPSSHVFFRPVHGQSISVKIIYL